MSVIKNDELESAVSDLMGGIEESHSPVTGDVENNESKEPETAPEGESGFIPYEEEEYDYSTDSAKGKDEETEEAGSPPETKDSGRKDEEVFSLSEKTALEKELDNYKKRLHDTQKAMHEANSKRAELQKRLDSINAGSEHGVESSEEDDEWFKDSDEKKPDEKEPDEKKSEESDLKQEIAELRRNQEEYQLEQRRREWLNEAEKVRREHEDFDELVFDRLDSLLDEETGDAMIRTLYMQHADRSPAGAYEFAKKLFGYQTKLRGDSEAVPETKEEPETKDPMSGKAGLDRLNSAEFADTPVRHSRNLVEEVFG